MKVCENGHELTGSTTAENFLPPTATFQERSCTIELVVLISTWAFLCMVLVLNLRTDRQTRLSVNVLPYTFHKECLRRKWLSVFN
jgi:hypothetical protein